MKPILLAAGLFLAFLLARGTFTVNAQAILVRPQPVKAQAADTRARRLAALETQDQSLALRQHEVEYTLDRIVDTQRKVLNQLERLSADPDSEPQSTLQDLEASRIQLLQKKAELRQELERVTAERHRVQEDWQTLTGMRLASR